VKAVILILSVRCVTAEKRGRISGEEDEKKDFNTCNVLKFTNI